MNSNSCVSTPLLRPVNGPAWPALSVLLLSGFVTTLDLFVVSVATPNMQVGLRARFAQIGSIVAGYELAFGVLLVIGGRLGDLFGRRRFFVAGLAGFTLSSAWCGLAPNAGFLIAARVLQGLTVTLLFPKACAVIRVNVGGDDSRRAFGLFGSALTGDDAAARTCGYSSASVMRMVYNLGAALLVCVLLLMLAKAQRSAG
ncbi:MFS transporter [Pseudomonas sp. S35]|uniref:MFS transporter n=1 Tax=Pseudomonas sp. S35 TaxID=1573719 RepID=UPI00135CBC69|nr:MFS transporter [Pseudomonas sp. S35]